jgi:lipopolysaccharide export system protein LptA
MKRPGSDKITYAEAGRLEYDFDAGIVEFSEQATITEGGNQISSNYLVYNIKDQRINAQSGGEGDEKVRITYTPAATATLPDEDQEQSEDQDAESGEIVPNDENVGEPETTGDFFG